MSVNSKRQSSRMVFNVKILRNKKYLNQFFQKKLKQEKTNNTKLKVKFATINKIFCTYGKDAKIVKK